MNSQFFQAIANLLRLIEGLNADSDQYGVVDNGMTLELSEAVHSQIKDSPELQEYEALGGSWYCYDNDELILDDWEPNPEPETKDFATDEHWLCYDDNESHESVADSLTERANQLTAIADEALAKYPLL